MQERKTMRRKSIPKVPRGIWYEMKYKAIDKSFKRWTVYLILSLILNIVQCSIIIERLME